MSVQLSVVVDQGFPDKGLPQTIIWPNFPRKRHENERNLTERGLWSGFTSCKLVSACHCARIRLRGCVKIGMCDQSVANLWGSVRDAGPPPQAFKFFQFHAVFWENLAKLCVHVPPPPGEFMPPPGGIPGSITASGGSTWTNFGRAPLPGSCFSSLCRFGIIWPNTKLAPHPTPHHPQFGIGSPSKILDPLPTVVSCL